MSPQDNTILRKSLDAVDRQKWQSIGVAIFTVVVTVIAFLRLGQAFQSGADIRRLLQLSIVAMVFWMSGLAFVIVIQLSTMTKRILRAIELAARK